MAIQKNRDQFDFHHNEKTEYDSALDTEQASRTKLIANGRLLVSELQVYQ